MVRSIISGAVWAAGAGGGQVEGLAVERSSAAACSWVRARPAASSVSHAWRATAAGPEREPLEQDHVRGRDLDAGLLPNGLRRADQARTACMGLRRALR